MQKHQQVYKYTIQCDDPHPGRIRRGVRKPAGVPPEGGVPLQGVRKRSTGLHVGSRVTAKARRIPCGSFLGGGVAVLLRKTAMINAAFVTEWSGRYPTSYDTKYYDPYIASARAGDADALRKLTEWKNVGKGPRPMKLWKLQERSFQRFLGGLKDYLQPNGSQQLRADFLERAPIWSIFWHHVLFGTPLFDVYTHMAYRWDVTGTVLSKKDARIRAPGHWPNFDRYCVWLGQKLESLRQEDRTMTERDLDRALVCWGEDQQRRRRGDRQ